jgi:hypothetical protein
VRLERAHAQFLREGKRLLVVSDGLLDRWGLAPRRNVTKKA